MPTEKDVPAMDLTDDFKERLVKDAVSAFVSMEEALNKTAEEGEKLIATQRQVENMLDEQQDRINSVQGKLQGLGGLCAVGLQGFNETLAKKKKKGDCSEKEEDETKKKKFEEKEEEEEEDIQEVVEVRPLLAVLPSQGKASEDICACEGKCACKGVDETGILKERNSNKDNICSTI